MVYRNSDPLQFWGSGLEAHLPSTTEQKALTHGRGVEGVSLGVHVATSKPLSLFCVLAGQ